MAAITHSFLSGVGFPVLRLRAGIARIGAALAERRVRHQHMRDLAAFSDRELADLGLSRADFLAISKGAFRRD